MTKQEKVQLMDAKLNLRRVICENAKRCKSKSCLHRSIHLASSQYCDLTNCTQGMPGSTVIVAAKCIDPKSYNTVESILGLPEE